MDDAGIIELFFSRDGEAIAECRREYGAYCRGIARRILGREADAEECENDTYLAAWNAIPPGETGLSEGLSGPDSAQPGLRTL